jgi:hypothetical protein
MEGFMSEHHIVVEPPFYPNLPDESHCLEACVKMIVEAIPPFTKLDYQDIDELTGKTNLKVKYSWPLKLYLELNRIGYEVSVIESFDYESFVDDPEKYLIDNYGDEVGKDQIENSDLANEIFYAKKLIESKTVKLINKTPELQDLFDTLSSGSLVICNVNQKILQGDNGYIGHAIVIYGFGDNVLYIHNPGPPYRPKQALDIVLFDKAWSYPNKNSRNILAVRSSV